MIANTIVLVVLLILVSGQEHPNGPEPFCSSKQVAPLLPLVIGEVVTVDVTNYFTGYNLSFMLQANNFSNLSPKFNIQSMNVSSFGTPIQMHLDHSGNQFGKDFVLLTKENGGATVLHYGHLPSRHQVPKIDRVVRLDYNKSLVCLDALYNADRGIVYVDCVVKYGLSYKNIFILIDAATGQITSNKTTPLYVQYSSISKRKILRYSDKRTGYEYIVRAHLAEGVDDVNDNNTYVEMIKVIDRDMETVAILDRSQLNSGVLSVMDVQIYKNQLFLLDYDIGLYRLDIATRQIFNIKNVYRGSYFSRFSVYSDDLQNQLLVAIGNSHAIHQINWDNTYDPRFITKYSLIQNSTLTQVFVNNDYVIAQSSVEASIIGEYSAQLNYTWVFARGTRIFSNAYLTIDHKIGEPLLDFDQDQAYILVLDDKGFFNYQILKTTLRIQENRPEMLGKEAGLAIIGTSRDAINDNVKYCVEQINIVFVDAGNMSLWPTNDKLIEEMYINYPGRLTIDLDRYAIGPNITYDFLSLTQKDGTVWFFKQNATNVIFNATTGPINFLHTDVIEQYGNNTVLLYCQDQNNSTYVSMCINEWQTVLVNCTVLSHYQHHSKINSFTTALLNGDFQKHYIYIFNLQGSRNTISMFYFSSSDRFGTITYPEGLEGQISNMAVSNGILFVTLPKVKKIDAYRLDRCTPQECPVEFSITASVLRPLGVSYFAPRRVRTTREHPEVLFIECLDSVLILDVDNQDRISLLKELMTDGTQKGEFEMAVNKDYLVIVSLPSLIEEYRMVNLYKGSISLHKKLPLYDYMLIRPLDLEFNDIGNLFFITAADLRNNKSVVMVYRLGNTLVNSLYDIIQVDGGRGDIELEVSGGVVNFVTIVKDGKFKMVKEYEHPSMVLEDEFFNIQFLIEAKNAVQEQQINKVKVTVANYPEDFKRSKKFPSTSAVFVKDRISKKFTWSDRGWFQGHVIDYYYKCVDCPKKFYFQGHIVELGELRLQAEDYARSPQGGFILWDDMFRMYPNGSIRSIDILPKPNQFYEQVCRKVTTDSTGLYSISACVDSYREVNLYITSYVSKKGFTMGPWKSGASQVASLDVINGLLILVDVDPDPAMMIRSGGIFIYALNLDGARAGQPAQIEYIDTNDMIAAHGWDAKNDIYVGNADLTYSGITQQYRLFVTEVRKGLFIVSFSYKKGYTQINLRSVDYIDLNEILISSGLHMPNDATFQTVTQLKVTYTPRFEVDTIVVVTKNYHNFEFNVIYQPDGRFFSCVLTKVYYRYGYYRTYNMAKAFNGFLVIPYTIPPAQEMFTNYTRQVIGLYDTSDYEDDDTSKGYKERYIMAAHTLNTTTQTSFDFNYTYRLGEETVGLVVIDPKNKIVSENRISKNLTIYVKDPSYGPQNLYLWPYSDFTKLLVTLQMNGLPDNSLTGWQIFLIVVGSIAVAVGLYFGGRWVFKKWMISRKKTYLLEEDEGAESDLEHPANIDMTLEDPALAMRQPLLEGGEENGGRNEAPKKAMAPTEAINASARQSLNDVEPVQRVVVERVVPQMADGQLEQPPQLEVLEQPQQILEQPQQILEQPPQQPPTSQPRTDT